MIKFYYFQHNVEHNVHSIKMQVSLVVRKEALNIIFNFWKKIPGKNVFI